MSCETICCATKVGDTELLIGEQGLVSPPRDPVALSENWWKVANLSPEAKENLGRKLRERIKNKFSLSVIAEKYLALYDVSENSSSI